LSSSRRRIGLGYLRVHARCRQRGEAQRLRSTRSDAGSMGQHEQANAVVVGSAIGADEINARIRIRPGNGPRDVMAGTYRVYGLNPPYGQRGLTGVGKPSSNIRSTTRVAWSPISWSARGPAQMSHLSVPAPRSLWSPNQRPDLWLSVPMSAICCSVLIGASIATHLFHRHDWEHLKQIFGRGETADWRRASAAVLRPRLPPYPSATPMAPITMRATATP